MTSVTTRNACEAMDRADPLAALRQEFVLPPGVVYLDGNSLGALPRAVPERIADVARHEWGEGLIRSWTAAGWIDAPRRVGAKIARLIGAAPDEVVVADSTSVNLFKLLVAALRLRPERNVIVSERGNFPTDLYITQSVCDLLGGRHQLRLVEAGDVASALDDRVALPTLTHVNFRSGALHDLHGLTAAAHAAGALVLWDLSHTAGALPVDLHAADADLAVGCGYKYLNGGPGAPAFLFVAQRLQDSMHQPLTGWLGHAAPFDFSIDYAPAKGIDRMLCGTPPILSLAALDAALDLWDRVDLGAMRTKSQALGDLFIALVETRCAEFGFRVACPRDANARGSQVSFAHADGYAIVQALIRRGVIGDFRAPDLLRFGLTPLYIRYVDVWDAVEHLRCVMTQREWDRVELKQRAVVT